MSTENSLQARILLQAGTCDNTWLFRNSVGQGWMGKVLSHHNTALTLSHPRRVTFGWGVGSSDILGWRSLVITPDMVGETIAQLIALEVKTATGRISEKQKNFIECVNRSGGIGRVVRSVEEAVNAVACKNSPVASGAVLSRDGKQHL